MNWTIIDTGTSSAKKNMEIDADLLAALDPSSASPILHLYDWLAPCATYGHFIHPFDHLSSKADFELAKRPTGGGLLFHISDWAFSILVPASHEAFSLNTLDNYAFINTLLIDIINRFLGFKANLSLLPTESPRDHCLCHFCMAKPTKYDVMLEGKKVCGGAQRRTKAGFLHQGTISLSIPDQGFLDRLLLDPSVSKAMFENTYPLMADVPLKEARKFLKNTFLAHLKECF
jgi:lipoate---protein ligase